MGRTPYPRREMKMKKYLPKHHAILYSTIIKNILDIIGDCSHNKIKELTESYARSRSARMAKRAIYDGIELNALSYLSYGELDVPKELIERTTNLDGKNAVQITTKCPWYEAWKEANHLEYGKVFCEVFDEALADGFHSTVKMKVPTTITIDNTPCKFVFENSCFSAEDKATLLTRNERIKKSATKPFIYHMGHLYTFFLKELELAYGEQGNKIILCALKEYAGYFDEEIVQDILSMKDINYEDISDYTSTN